MLEKVCPDVWRMEIPLPGNPLKSINSYVVKGGERSLIIDTGLHLEVCREAFLAGLEALGVALEECDIFITHMHADHVALLTKISLPEGTKVMIGAKDAEFIRGWTGYGQLYPFAYSHGFPVDELEAQADTNPFLKLTLDNMPRLTPLEGDEVLHVGAYSLQCVPTPGHSEGHLCLYEPSGKFLFSGDHVLGEITPNIQGWSEHRNPLDEYLQSLDRALLGKEVDLVLPGHRKPFTDYSARVGQLKLHHAKRAEEALGALGQCGKTAYEVAPRMSWDFSVKDWQQWPIVQRWFATGEALAHLKWLVKEGRAVERSREGRTLFLAS